VLIVPPTERNVSAITGTVSFWPFAAIRTGLPLRTGADLRGADRAGFDDADGIQASMITPSSTWVWPKNECPRPRIATLSPWRFANCTSFAMSCASGRCAATALRRWQRKQCRTTREPLTEIMARDIPLHNLTSMIFCALSTAEATGRSAATP
jgi:hypothetical protein